MKAHKFILIVISLFILSLFSKCYKDNGDCDVNKYCDTLPYDSGYVNVQSSFKGNGIPIIVYEGYIDDNVILFYDTMWAEEYSYYLPINKRYAVEAYYYSPGKAIIALDGAKLKPSSFYNCGEECHELSEITLDVKKL